MSYSNCAGPTEDSGVFDEANDVRRLHTLFENVTRLSLRPSDVHSETMRLNSLGKKRMRAIAIRDQNRRELGTRFAYCVCRSQCPVQGGTERC